MSRRLALVVSALAALLAFAAPASAAQDSYIVVLKDSEAHPGVVANEHAKKFGSETSHIFSAALKGYSAKIPPGKVDEVRNDPDVVTVSEDREVHALGTTTLAAGDTIPTGILREGAAAGTTVQTAASSSVAVIDTGIDLTHPDLNVSPGKNCVNTGATPNDDNGHGSHVSGSIAARNNGAGVVGAVPGTKLYAVKVLNGQGSGTTAQVICGIDWVTANAAALNIKVANMSLGGGGTPLQACAAVMQDAEHKAICNSTAAGVTYVVAAGNSAWDFDYAPNPDTPAVYPEVLTVTAVSDSDGQPGAIGGNPTCRSGEQDDRYASFSSYATTSAGINHTIAGPGVCIRSTWRNGGYSTISGTSMATPNVAGLVAACLDAACAGMTPAQVIQKMRSDAQAHATLANGFTGDPLHPISGRYFGYLGWGGVTSSDGGGGGGTPPPAGDFSLSASPNSVTDGRGGGSVSSAIAITRINSFSGTVGLSATCPQKVSCSLSPSSTAGNSSTLTINANKSARTGTYTVTVRGVSGGLTRTTTLSLRII